MLSLGALNAAYADSATWTLNPISSDWNTAANWTPATVPNGPADIATFSTSSRSTVSLSNVQIEVASLIFDTAATNYTISVGGHNNFGGELTIGDAGIVNNSGKLQTFVADVARGTAGEIIFIGNAHAGSFAVSGSSVGTLHLNDTTSGVISNASGDASFTRVMAVNVDGSRPTPAPGQVRSKRIRTVPLGENASCQS